MGYLSSFTKYLFNRRVAGAPIAVYLLVIDRCNQHCLMCNVWQGLQAVPQQELLTTEEIMRLIDDLSRSGVKMLLISGGEPLLRKDILEIVVYARKKIPYVRLHTNGMLVDEALAEALARSDIDDIWISLDGVGHTYDVIRGKPGAFAAMAKGVENLNAAIRKYSPRAPGLMFNCVVSRHNLGEVVEVCRWAVEHGAEELLFHRVTDADPALVDKTQGQIGAPALYSKQFTSQGKLVDLPLRIEPAALREIESMCRRADVTLFIDPLLRSGKPERPLCRCLLIWLDAMILPDGSVVPCQMFDRLRVGNIRQKGLVEIWNGEEMQRLRREVKTLGLCRLCCNTRRTLFDQLRSPTNFKRILLSRKVRAALMKRRAKG